MVIVIVQLLLIIMIGSGYWLYRHIEALRKQEQQELEVLQQQLLNIKAEWAVQHLVAQDVEKLKAQVMGLQARAMTGGK